MIPVSLGFPPVEDWPHHVPHVHHTQCLRQMLHWSLSKRPLSKKIWLRGSWVSFSTCSIHALVFYCVSCVSFNHTAILTSNILQAKLTHPLAFHLSIWSILWCIDTPPSFDTYIAINKSTELALARTMYQDVCLLPHQKFHKPEIQTENPATLESCEGIGILFGVARLNSKSSSIAKLGAYDLLKSWISLSCKNFFQNMASRNTTKSRMLASNCHLLLIWDTAGLQSWLRDIPLMSDTRNIHETKQPE